VFVNLNKTFVILIENPLSRCALDMRLSNGGLLRQRKIEKDE
jgi:hypothetical protein